MSGALRKLSLGLVVIAMAASVTAAAEAASN